MPSPEERFGHSCHGYFASTKREAFGFYEQHNPLGKVVIINDDEQ